MTSPDFIEIYDDSIDAATCQALIARFNASGHAVRGATGGGVDVSLKDSWDIRLDDHPAWADARQMLNEVAFACLRHYARRYPHVVLAPLQIKMPDSATGQLMLLTAEVLATMGDNALNQLLNTVLRPGSINLQKYLADQGGYPYWHSEQYPTQQRSRAGSQQPSGDGAGDSLHRVLLWSVYLNDSFQAGETEFLHQQRLIRPRTGSLLMAPAAFTHTHRGNRAQGGDKYIATSWALFQRSETLYGAQPR
jgi:2OG-Fe(II) oxygenase superfamily